MRKLFMMIYGKIVMKWKRIHIDADELYTTDKEEYDNYGIPDFDYGALVDEIDDMEKNKEQVNLTIH